MTTLSARPFRLRLRVYVYKVENSLITAATIDRAQLAQQQCEALRPDGRHLGRQGLDVGLVEQRQVARRHVWPAHVQEVQLVAAEPCVQEPLAQLRPRREAHRPALLQRLELQLPRPKIIRKDLSAVAYQI